MNVDKLEASLRSMVQVLHQHRELVVHQNINQFYYMQKAEEIHVLQVQVAEAQLKAESLQRLMISHSREVFCQWRKDIRWMNRHLHVRSEAVENVHYSKAIFRM